MSTSDVLQKSLAVIAEGISDIWASKKEQWVLSAAHLVQQLNRKGQFLEQLSDEWTLCFNKGLFKEDYQDAEQHQECLFEVLDSLDKDVPDKTRFILLKKIILVAASEKILDRNSFLPQEYLRVCRKLCSGEIMVMYAAHKLAGKKASSTETMIPDREWERSILGVSGLVHPELVSIHADGLEAKRLLLPLHGTRRDKRRIEPHYGLTRLAWGICEFIKEYRTLQEPPVQ